MTGVSIPHLSSELLAKIDKQFPHKCPSPEDSERSIWMYAGKRELIDWLITHQRMDEDNNILTGD